MRRRLNVCNRAQPIQKGRLKKPAKQVFQTAFFVVGCRRKTVFVHGMKNRPDKMSGLFKYLLAETVGFEPTKDLRP